MYNRKRKLVLEGWERKRRNPVKNLHSCLSFTYVPLCRFSIISVPRGAVCLWHSTEELFLCPSSHGWNKEPLPRVLLQQTDLPQGSTISTCLCVAPPCRTPLEFSLAPRGYHSFATEIQGSELLKVFFPSSFLKMEGAKASQRFAVVPPARRDRGSPAVCTLAFSLTSQAGNICACTVPSPAAPCLSSKALGKDASIEDWQQQNPAGNCDLLTTSLSHTASFSGTWA